MAAKSSESNGPFEDIEGCEKTRLELKVFVVMPFGSHGEYQGGVDESNFVYSEIIEPGIKRAVDEKKYCLKILREVDKSEAGSITNSIVRSLADADIVIVDVTGKNPNVFFELGIRYALRSRITLLLTQDPHEVPFDIKDYRFVTYSKYKPDNARSDIASFITQCLVDTSQADSMVFNVFKDMSVVIPGILESHGVTASHEFKETLRWEQYMERIRFAIKIFETPMKEGRFAPDALLGISNGGLIVADLLGREAFQGTPIVGLWANRRSQQTNSPFWFFDNMYNDALCGVVKETAQTKHPNSPVSIVLVDDHYGSGTTALHATSYLRDRLGNDTDIVYFPLVSKRIDYIQVVEDILPYSKKNSRGQNIFQTTREEFIRQLNTDANFFPYLGKMIKD
jgi:hypoxanthine phosphoribosyltransferase